MKRLDDPFYPVTSTRRSGHLARDNGHGIYFEDAGNPDGLPLLLCHGGPGGRSSPSFLRLIDSSRYRVIQFDQRGCGKSEPVGELGANSLQHSIADIEALREHLDIECWVVTGGSWGSTLALAYAEDYPERVLGLLLISMWLCRPLDIEWWFSGVRAVFPELWQQFAEWVPEAERGDLRSAYCKRILGGDAELAAEAGRRLYLYEEGFMHFDVPLIPADESRGSAYSRVFAHYASNEFFLRDNQLIEHAHKVTRIPTIIVTGRYDMCTPPNNAYDLASCLPHVDLRIIAGAGHYPTENALARACVTATNDICRIVESAQELSS